MTESSLNELNEKLEKPVTSLQFRPNIVVTGTDPFVEDKWEWIKIGENVVIRNVKPCPRFVVQSALSIDHNFSSILLHLTDVP